MVWLDEDCPPALVPLVLSESPAEHLRGWRTHKRIEACEVMPLSDGPSPHTVGIRGQIKRKFVSDSDACCVGILGSQSPR